MIKKQILPGGHYNNTITILQSSTGTSIKNMIKNKSLQEDEGYRDAEDADTAVLQSKTGLPVHKKKEWYIWKNQNKLLL